MAQGNKSKDQKKNIHEEHRKRMHSKFDVAGFEGWSRVEILEYMLYNVFARKNTNPIAHGLLEYSANSIVMVLENAQDFRMIKEVKDVGESTARFLRSLKEFILYYQQESVKENPIQLTRDTFFKILDMINMSNDIEEIAMVCMDRFLRVKAAIKITEYSSAGHASFQISRLIKLATDTRANNVALIHTHPSGVDRASYEDVVMTREAKHVLEAIHVNLVDHFIVCGDRVISVLQTIRKMEERDAGANWR